MANTSVNATISKIKVVSKPFDFVRWLIIVIVFILTIGANSILRNLSIELESVVILIILSLVLTHGTKRYGFKNMLAFIIITWIVSNLFEALSVYMGFPFGKYHYTLAGPRILDVPVIIMPSYIAMGYLAWTLSLVLCGQYSQRLRGKHIFIVPFIATFIMVMWDVVMDPMEANVYKSWIWEDGGGYFGVPVSNYFGWFFVVYIILQFFAILISRFDTRGNENGFNKPFWIEAVVLYFIQGLSYLLKSISGSGNYEINTSMGLISIFTMIFIAILSAITICNSKRKSEIDYSKS